MKMNNEKMLTSLLHTVQMGQCGIKSVMDSAVRPGLKQEMHQQLETYDRIEAQARQLAAKHSLQLKDIHPGILKMSDLMARARLVGGERDSKIAGMLIQGNTRGMILGMKNLRKGKKTDAQVQDLARSLLEQERLSIETVKGFL
jgi:hypothetical protein